MDQRKRDIELGIVVIIFFLAFIVSVLYLWLGQ